MNQLKQHWETIHSSKKNNEVSWWQDIPETSLNFIHGFNLPKTASIIDIGGGDSKLVDCLLEEGFENVTILDISSKALDRAKSRLGKKAGIVKWITSDITEFHPETKYDLWHDRATFHFLTQLSQIEKYVNLAARSVEKFLTIGTFSDNGPDKCSGLEVKQYNEEQLQNTLLKEFEKIKCITEDHITPFNTNQNFLFCSFKKTV